MKSRSPEQCLRLEKWQGPPDINKVNISFKVSFCFLFLIRKTKRVCLYSLFRHKGSVNEDLSLLLKFLPLNNILPLKVS